MDAGILFGMEPKGTAELVKAKALTAEDVAESTV